MRADAGAPLHELVVRVCLSAPLWVHESDGGTSLGSWSQCAPFGLGLSMNRWKCRCFGLRRRSLRVAALDQNQRGLRAEGFGCQIKAVTASLVTALKTLAGRSPLRFGGSARRGVPGSNRDDWLLRWSNLANQFKLPERKVRLPVFPTHRIPRRMAGAPVQCPTCGKKRGSPVDGPVVNSDRGSFSPRTG